MLHYVLHGGWYTNVKCTRVVISCAAGVVIYTRYNISDTRNLSRYGVIDITHIYNTEEEDKTNTNNAGTGSRAFRVSYTSTTTDSDKDRTTECNQETKLSSNQKKKNKRRDNKKAKTSTDHTQ